MRFRDPHERQDFGLGDIHELTELRQLGTQLIGDAAPLLAGGFERLLGERGIDRGEHALALAFAGMGERVSQEVDTGGFGS